MAKRIRTEYFRNYFKAHARTGEYAPTYAKFLYQARKRKLEVTITQIEYLELRSLPCHYCGGELPVFGTGVDRVDSGKGYVTGNTVSCCSICNIAKSDLTWEEFIGWVERVYKKNCGGQI